MTAPIVHGGGITAAAAAYGGRPEDWLDLSTGINPCPPAVPAIEPRAWHRLPDRYLAERAQAAAARYYGSGETMPLSVPGTQSVIQLLPRLIAPASRVAIVSPTYGEYARAFSLAGCAVDAVSGLDGIGAGHTLAVVINPNNPDGRVHSRADLLDLAARMAARGGILVVDEAFGDGEATGSLAAQAGETDGLIVFRSFGKFFGMAGVRLGFVIARPAVLSRFEGWLGPWAVSGPALAVAAELLSADPGPLRRVIAERKAGLVDVLCGAGLSVRGGASLFALVEDEAAGRLHEHLCRAHILVRRFDYDSRWLRFGLAPDAAGDRRLADALAGFAR